MTAWATPRRAAALPNPHRCAAHPQAEAGWACTGCQRTLCPDCVAAVERVTEDRFLLYELCVHCDARVEVLTVPGSEWTFWELLKQSFRVPPQLYLGLLLLALYLIVLVAQYAPLEWTAKVWGFFVSPVLWAMFFMVLQAAARGAEQVDDRAAQVDLLREVAWPTVNAVGLSFVLGGVVWWLVPANAADAYAHPAYQAVSVAAGILFPSMLMTLAMRRPLWVALWPGTWIRHVRVLRGDYLLVAAVTVALTVLGFQWVAVAYAARAARILLFPFFFQLLAVVAWMVEGRLLGLLLRTRGGHIGYPFAADQRVPALADARPRGVRKEAPPPPRKVAPAPIALDVDERRPRTPDLPSLASALERGDLDGAVALYEALPSLSPLAISVSSHLAIGQAAAARGNLALAVRALKTAATAAPDHPDAPRACVILGRIYAERLSDAASADKLFRYVVQRYPGTAAAQFAQQRLG